MAESDSLAIIRDEVSCCHKCRGLFPDIIFTHRFGNVIRKAQDIFIVGERPGQAAGDKLELTDEEYEERIRQNYYGRFIGSLGLDFDRVYFSNIVKCAAHGQRESDSQEVENCKPFLLRQLELKKPEVIIACGRPTVRGLTGIKVRVGAEAGKVLSWRSVPLIVSPNPTGTYFKVNQDKIMTGIKRSLVSVMKGEMDMASSREGSKTTIENQGEPTPAAAAKTASRTVFASEEPSDLVVAQVSKYLLSIGAVPKGKQKSKQGWTLDGEIINLEPPSRPNWFAFNKLRKLERIGDFRLDDFCRQFKITKEQVKTDGAARSAIWVHCSVGTKTMIRIIDWMQKRKV